MDIFKSTYIYIYMQGIVSVRGMPSAGARGFWGKRRRPRGGLLWGKAPEGQQAMAVLAGLAWPGHGNAGAEQHLCGPTTWRAPEFNKSGVKAICHGIFEE